MTKAERSRNLRYKRGALASMGWGTMLAEQKCASFFVEREERKQQFRKETTKT